MKKVLLIRFSSIGDIVLCSPVIRCLKEQAELEIHFLTKKAFLDLMEPNPHITKVHCLEDSLSTTISALKKEHYDYIIDLHNNIRTKKIKSALKAQSKSFKKLNIQKWLLVNFKKNKLPNLHIVDRYLAAADVFQIKNDQKGLDFYFPENTRNLTELLDSKYIENPCLSVVIGGQHATKMLPKEKILELINALDFPIILLGGPEDVPVAEWLEDSYSGDIFNAVGKFKLAESCRILKSSDLVITHDTGLMHVAAAFQKNILSIWGNTVPEFGMYPYLPGPDSYQFQVSNLSCRPCSKIGYDACPKTHFNCMNQQPIQAIADKANEILRKR